MSQLSNGIRGRDDVDVRLAAVRWLRIPHVDDERGSLTVLESSDLPFEIKRVFYMHDVPAEQVRGVHAHRYTQQILIAASDAFRIDVSDGDRTQTFDLDDPNRGLYLPAMVWVRLHAFQPATVALVLCDRPYEPHHVVRTWDEYQALLRQLPCPR